MKNMMYTSTMEEEKKIRLLKTAYPKGTVIKIYHINGRILPSYGIKAEVQYVDDNGNLHTKLENGKTVVVTKFDNFSMYPTPYSI